MSKSLKEIKKGDILFRVDIQNEIYYNIVDLIVTDINIKTFETFYESDRYTELTSHEVEVNKLIFNFSDNTSITINSDYQDEDFIKPGQGVCSFYSTSKELARKYIIEQCECLYGFNLNQAQKFLNTANIFLLQIAKNQKDNDESRTL